MRVEYCRIVELACGVTFHVEHFVPESKGGIATLSNLVLSCPGCNLAKGARTFIVDANGTKQAFFNPREYEPMRLGWHLHFILSTDTGIIVGRTPRGQATVKALNVNSANRLYARMLQIRIGLLS